MISGNARYGLVAVVALVFGVAAYLLFGGSSILGESLRFNGTLPPASGPAPTSTASAFVTTCDPKPDVPGNGPYLTCSSAVRAAIATLPRSHPAIRAAAFHYDCPVGADCAVWLFGAVEISFVGPDPEAVIHLVLGPDGHVSIAPAVRSLYPGPTT
jgi:hypothetical protein